MAQRIADQVVQHPPDALGIHPQRIHSRFDFPIQGHTLASSQLRKALQGVRDQVRDRVHPQFERQATGVQLRHLKQVVDQQREGGDILLGGAQIALHGFGIFDHAVGQRFQNGANRSQRCVQVMTHPGD